MAQTPSKKLQAAIAILLLVGSCGWLFTHLGGYYFWDDEADTVLFADAVWKTGDTSALVDGRLYAYRNGSLLTDLKNRYTPPLAYCVAAPFVGVSDANPLASRLPFAVCGLLGVVLILVWLRQSQASTTTWVLMTVGLLGNVSFFLYARQCRYYALSMLTTLAIAYLYTRYDGRRRTLWLMSFVSLLLLATHYLNYFALYACLAVDYFAWRRKERTLSGLEWLILLGPQLIVGAMLVWIWNPLANEMPSAPGRNWLLDKLTLLFWNLRDLNACEYGVGLLMLIAPLVAWWRKDIWLWQSSVAGMVYVVATTLGSPQIVALTDVADVRYLTPLIPLCIFITVRTVWALSAERAWLAIPLAVLAFGTNVLHVPWSPDHWRSTAFLFAQELAQPRPTATEVTSRWINEHVAPGKSVWVAPGSALAGHAYPLMIHAPLAVYAWQLDEPPDRQFAGLPDIHVVGRVPVDYMIGFGPGGRQVREMIDHLRAAGHTYRQVESLDVYWKDAIRPELVWHEFRPVTKFDRIKEGVYVYQRVEK